MRPIKMSVDERKFKTVWFGIIARCYKLRNPLFVNYGGRGIDCLWKSFEEFKDDMFDSYLEHKQKNTFTSIDRIDNNGNYCKENCRWATMKEQNNNRRKRRFYRLPAYFQN